MNLDKLNQWLTLAANIGVLLGIIALVMELNQSTRLAAVEAYQTRNSEIQLSMIELALSPELIEILNKFDNEGVDSLDQNELRRARAWNQAIIRRMESQYYQYQNGFLEEEVVERTFENIVSNSYKRWTDLDILDVIANSEWQEEIERRIDLEAR